MNKSKIILFAILIIIVFTGLFIMNKDKLALKSELKSIIHPYHGKPGFVIMSLPDFLFFDLIDNGDSKNSPGKSIKSTRLLYFHENNSLKTQSDSVFKNILDEMDKTNFILIAKQDSTKKGSMEVRWREMEEDWNEAAITFCSDSSLLLVNLVNKLSKSSIMELSETLKNEDFKFK